MDKNIFFEKIVNYILKNYPFPEDIEEGILTIIIRNNYRQLYPRLKYNGGVQINLLRGYKEYIGNCRNIFINEKQLKDNKHYN